MNIMAKNKEATEHELHELEAERNALKDLLFQSLGEAVAHIEHLLGAMLLTHNKEENKEFHEQLDRIETLDESIMHTVHVMGETSSDITVKSTREENRERLAIVEARIAELTANE